MRTSFLVSCEHAVNIVPTEFASLFEDDRELLDSHMAWDPGALDVATGMAAILSAPLAAGTVSRLVIDLNRSPHNRSLFSSFTRGLEPQQKELLLRKYHRPYRHSVEEMIRGCKTGDVLCHVSVHSFTPVFNGVERNCQVGLLYDPSRKAERELCRRWKGFLEPSLRVRLNYPYRGTSDGCVTMCRRLFPAGSYMGLELEINQDLVRKGGGVIATLARELARSLLKAAG